MTSDLITKAAEIRAGLVERLRREADAMHAAVGGVTLGETSHAANWADKPHRVLYDALDHMRRAAKQIEQQAAELDLERRRHQNTRDSRGRWKVSTFKEQRRATAAESERDGARAALQVAKDGWRDAEDAATTLAAERDELLREKGRMGAEVEAVRLIVGNDVRLMDPPDGGDPTTSEKVANLRRMFEAADRSLVKIKEAGKELYKWTLVIESAMHHDAPRDHPKVVAAIKQLFSALENAPAGLADAHSKSPSPSSQSERIAVLEAALRPFSRIAPMDVWGAADNDEVIAADPILSVYDRG